MGTKATTHERYSCPKCLLVFLLDDPAPTGLAAHCTRCDAKCERWGRNQSGKFVRTDGRAGEPKPAG